MNAGRFNRRILLQTLTSADDNAGGTTGGVWNDGIWCFAEVIPATASRRLNYNQIITEGWTHIITTYFMGVDLQPNVRMRAVLDDGTIMLIHSVVNVDYKNHMIELAAFADPMADKYDFPIEAGFGFVDDFEDVPVVDDNYFEIIADITEYAVDENGNGIFNEIGEQVIL